MESKNLVADTEVKLLSRLVDVTQGMPCKLYFVIHRGNVIMFAPFTFTSFFNQVSSSRDFSSFSGNIQLMSEY